MICSAGIPNQREEPMNMPLAFAFLGITVALTALSTTLAAVTALAILTGVIARIAWEHGRHHPHQ